MELIMSTTFYTPATIRVRSRGRGLIASVETWWMSYLTRRIERAAIIQLHGMSERELQDIGLTRSQIERAVRGELDDGWQGRGCDGTRRILQSRAGDHYPPMDLGLPGTTLLASHQRRVRYFLALYNGGHRIVGDEVGCDLLNRLSLKRS